MTICKKCHQPMISAGDICGRASCAPSPAAARQMNKYLHRGYKGANTRHERSVIAMPDNAHAAPLNTIFGPSMREDILHVAVADVVSKTARYKAPVSVREFLGSLSNAARRWFRATVRYSKWDPLRESLLAAGYAFRDAMVMESSREVATRDHDYARHLEYCASNLQLYLRDKRNREAACGIV